MRIMFEQTGGLMGRKTSLNVELDSLPDAQARALRLLLNQAGFNLPDLPPADDSARDPFHYKLQVESGAYTQSVQTGDTSMPDALRPLIEELTRLARSQQST